jgi:hypothetical protein
MRWTARVAAAVLISAASAVSLSGVANASEIGGGIGAVSVPAHYSRHSGHDHDGRHHHVGLLGGVAEGVGGLLHGVGHTLRPLLRGLI